MFNPWKCFFQCFYMFKAKSHLELFDWYKKQNKKQISKKKRCWRKIHFSITSISLTFVLLVIKFLLCFIFVEQIFTNITTRTNCYTSNINITPRFLSFSRLPKMTRNDQVPFICVFFHRTIKVINHYQIVLITTINHIFTQTQTAISWLSLDGQRQTDRQTDRRPADVYNQAMEPDKFRSIYGNSHL